MRLYQNWSKTKHRTVYIPVLSGICRYCLVYAGIDRWSYIQQSEVPQPFFKHVGVLKLI